MRRNEIINNTNPTQNVINSVIVYSTIRTETDGTMTGTIGPEASLSNIDIPLDTAKHCEETKYMNVNEINFDKIGSSERSAHIKYIEQNLGVKVFLPVGPEGDQSKKINDMKIIGVTSDGNYLFEGDIEG